MYREALHVILKAPSESLLNMRKKSNLRFNRSSILQLRV